MATSELQEISNCSAVLKTLNVLSKAMNCSLKLSSSAHEFRTNLHGELWFWSVWKIHEYIQIKERVFSTFRGLSCVYCDFESRMRNPSLSVWIEPFDYLAWGVAIFLISGLIVISKYRFKENVYKKPVFFPSFCAIFKQPVDQSNCNLSQVSLIILWFVSLTILSHYEYFITSSLIAPEKFKEIESLMDFIDLGYTVIYVDNLDSGYQRQHKVIENELVYKGKDPEIFNKSSYHLLNLVMENIYLHINPSKPKSVFLKHPWQDETVIGWLQNYGLGGKYKCYLSKNVADVQPGFFKFQFIPVALASKVMKRLQESGLSNIRDEWDKLRFLSSTKGFSPLDVITDYITFENLNGLFLLYFSGLGGGLLVFVLYYVLL